MSLQKKVSLSIIGVFGVVGVSLLILTLNGWTGRSTSRLNAWFVLIAAFSLSLLQCADQYQNRPRRQLLPLLAANAVTEILVLGVGLGLFALGQPFLAIVLGAIGWVLLPRWAAAAVDRAWLQQSR